MRYLISFILTIYSTYIFCQVFDNSQAHFNIKWKQISTEKITLIFPQEFSAQAPNLAMQLEHFLDQVSRDFKRPTSKIPFIVQTHHVQPNGFVMLAPRKSELYSTPPAIADNQEWLPNLALHESRHVAQFDNLTGKLKGSFFQQLALALFGLNLPSWYFEGDAVLHETIYSTGGRGRLSSWNMPVRANILSGRNYGFNKYVHGSFKDIVPSYYTIGYLMVSELFERDTLIHGKIIDEMNGKLLRPFNFQRALKKHSGMRGNQLFDTTMLHLQQSWNDHVDSTAARPFPLTDRYATDYYIPQVVDQKIYVLKDSRQKVPTIVYLDPSKDMKEKKVIKVGRQIMPYFHIHDHLIVWDELRKDPRFQKQTYNIINIYDLQTQKIKALTHKTRYYTPTLSPNLQTIACVEIDLANKSSLILLDSKTGKIKTSIPMPEDLQIQQPQYHKSGHKIVAIALGKKGTNLVEINLNTKEIKTLFEWNNIQYERPIYHGNKIIYKANYNAQDDIYQLDNGRISRITHATHGAFNPSVQDDTLWYNDYMATGYKINQTSFDHIDADPVSPAPVQALYPRQNAFRFDPAVDNGRSYDIKDYHVTAHSINFHSLTLSGNDFESFDNLRPGLFWLSNDVLNTTQVKLGYEYDMDIRKSIYSAEISYQRYYPKFSLSYRNYGQIDQAKNPDGSYTGFDWREHAVSANIQLPFSIYRRHYTYSYGFNFATSYLQRYNVSLSNLQNFHTSVSFPLNYQIYLNRNHTMSSMDLTPRWGQNFSFTYRHIPFDADQKGAAWSFRTNFYFPGILLNHGLQVRYSIQEKSGRYTPNNDIPLPEGFSFYPTLYLKNTLLMNYRFPVAYPDWSIGSLAYIKRIRGDFSANYQNLESADWTPKTAGIGLSLDMNFFKYPLPLFSLAGRLTYIHDAKARQTVVPTYSISYSY